MNSTTNILESLQRAVARIQGKSKYLCNAYDDALHSAEVAVTTLAAADLQLDQAILANSDGQRLSTIRDMLQTSLPRSLIAIIQDFQARVRPGAKLFRVFGTDAHLVKLLNAAGVVRSDTSDADVSQNALDDWQQLHPSFRICGNGDVI